METAYVSSHANYLAPQPLQFEVKNWLSGHGRIVQSGVSDGSRVRKDGKNRVQRPRRGRVEDRCGWQAKRMAQRHTVHFDTPPRKDGLERTGSIRGHRSTRSCPHQQTRQVCSGKAEGMLGLGAPGGLPEENMEDPGPGTMTAEHNGRSWHRRTLSSQRGAYSWMVERERASYASSVDSGDTSLGTSTQFSSPPLSPLSLSPWSPTFLHLSASSFLKPPVIPSPAASSSPATVYSDSVYSDSQTGASSTDSTGTSSPSSSARANSPSSTFKGRPPNLHLHHYSLPSSASPQFSESPPSPLPSTMMEDNSRLQRAFSVLKPSKIRSNSKDKKGIDPPTIILPDVLSPLDLPQPQLGMGNDSPSYGYDHQYQPNRYIDYAENATKRASFLDDDSSDEEDPSPTLLGSLDYHKFLQVGTASGRKAQVDFDQTSPFPPIASSSNHGAAMGLGIGSHQSPQTALSPLSQEVAVHPTANHAHRLRTKESLPILEQERSGPSYTSAFQDMQLEGSPIHRDPAVRRLAGNFDWGSPSKATPSKTDPSLEEFPAFPANARAFGRPTVPTTAPIVIGDSQFNSSRATSTWRMPRRQLRLPTSPSSPVTTTTAVDMWPLSGRSSPELEPDPEIPQTSRPLIGPEKDMPPQGILGAESPVLGVEYPTPGPQRAQKAAPVGSIGSILWAEIDYEKPQQIIGPLTKQLPPPTGPPPPPPTDREGRSTRRQNIEVKQKERGESTSASEQMALFANMTPTRHRAHSVMSRASTAGLTEESVETNAGQKSVKRLGTALRQKVSALFGEEARTSSISRSHESDRPSTSTSSYRPISMTSPDNNTFSGIFDDVFHAACDLGSEAARPTGYSVPSARPSQSQSGLSEGITARGTALQNRMPSRVVTLPITRAAIADRLAARLGVTDASSRAAIMAAFDEVCRVTPPLTSHPATRGNLELQARLGMLVENADSTTAPVAARVGTPTATAGLLIPPLHLDRQRPTQVAVSTRTASRSVTPAVEPGTGYTTRTLVRAAQLNKGPKDVDPAPTFDRTIDVTWYRFSNRSEHRSRESHLPNMAEMFDAFSTVFMVKYSRGLESNNTPYDRLQRFPYFDLPGPIRFQIMEKLLEEYLPGKPILLNHARQASPVWPDDAFATLRQVLGPLRSMLMACPRLRADIMTALLMIQPFHVIFSPFVKPGSQPLPTKWLFKYLYFMQDVRVELDMTKLGFGPTWEATGMSTRLWDIGNLVNTFVEQMLRRDPHAHPMAKLTIHCRRFFGYRQGDNPHHGDVDFYRSPVGQSGEQTPSSQPPGQPWNYGRAAASFPPSTSNPCSGHRRHHTGGPERVPFLHEGHMTVADPFHKLTGRVWSVRMVGMSEKWTMQFYKFWPEAEFHAIPKEDLVCHLDRYTPSQHSYVAPGHAVFLDYGVRAGLHRFPPLPDSEPMVCTGYDADNDVFLEVGTGNIVTVQDNGVDIIARAKNPSIPKRDLPYRRGSPMPPEGPTLAPSRIPCPIRRRVSPIMQAMRTSTPKKALQLLGLDDGPVVTPDGSPTLQDDEDDFCTPTALRPSSTVIRGSQLYASAETGADHEESRHGRSNSTPTSGPRALSSNKSYHALMGGKCPRSTK